MRKPFLILLAGALLLSACGAPQPEPVSTAPLTVPEPTSPGEAPVPTPFPEPEGDPAERRLAAMTVEDKAFQMLLFCCHEESEFLSAAERGVGGLCLYTDAFAGKDREQVIAMTAALQQAAPLPLLLAVDEEGGTVNRVSLNPQLRDKPFSAPRPLFDEGGWELVESDTEEKARLLLDLGLNVNLAPVADVPLMRGNYIFPRCFSFTTSKTEEYVTRVVGVMRREGIGSSLKHFPGYGGSTDTHRGVAYDYRSFSYISQYDLPPFAAGIAAGADSVLVSHNIVLCIDDEYPASLSPEVHRILRQDLGFEGVVLCDDLAMGAIRQFTDGQNAAVRAVLAGNDLLCCADYEQSAAAIVQAVADGVLTEDRLDESVMRILRWKQALGLAL